MRRFLASLFALNGLFAPGLGHAQTVARVATLEDRGRNLGAEALVREIYARAGLRVEFEPLPLRRAALLMQQGQIDADWARAQVFFDAHPQVVQVPEVLAGASYWAFRLGECPRRVEVAELAQGIVIHDRGALVVESLLPPAARVAASNPDEAAAHLRLGRAQWILMGFSPGTLTAFQARHPTLCRVRLPVLTLNFFHALAPHRVDWAAPLSAALRAMKQDGSYDRILRQHEMEPAPRLASKVR